MQFSKSLFILTILGAACLPIACADDPEPEARPEATPPTATSPPSGSISWVVPVNVDSASNPSQDDWYNFAWQTFLALNWPAVAPTGSTNRGQPDTTLALGASNGGAMIPTVWLTFRDLGSTMLDEGADPGAWNSAQTSPISSCAPVQSGTVAPGFQPMMLGMISKTVAAPIPQDDVDEADTTTLIDQLGRYVIYDVRLNQSEYTYITKYKYYNASNQVKASQSGGIAPFPRTGQDTMFNGMPLPPYAQYGSTELKAAWRVLDPQKDDFSRYYTQVGYFVQPDGKTCEGPVTFGLVGFHILRLTATTPSTWYWASFEQVDNTSVPSGVKRPDGSPLTPSFSPTSSPGGNCGTGTNVGPAPVSGNINWSNTNTPVNVCRVTPIDNAIQAVNTFWQGKVANTVWQYYQLVNTVNPMVQGGPGYVFPPLKDTTAKVNTNIMANTTMETYFQSNSCMDCHGFATPQGAAMNSSNQIFTFLLMNADSAGTTQKRRGLLSLK